VYVVAMAVSPEHQGKGSCSRLMRLASSYADKHGLPAYLECSGDKNPAIYGRYGYTVTETASLQLKKPGAPAFDKVHAMVRSTGGK